MSNDKVSRDNCTRKHITSQNSEYSDMKDRIAAALLCLTLLALPMPQASGNDALIMSQNLVWDKSGNPYLIQSDWVIAAGHCLTVRPGVKVLFGAGANLVIEGDLVALGTAAEPIVFTSASQTPSPGDWGSLRFVTADTTLSYDANGAFIKGSRLEFCIIEYGGMPARGTPREFLGGAIHCRKSSPYLKNLTIRYNRSLCGSGIYCHEFASPYIQDCLFLENEAGQSGGGLNCFFYSNAIVKHNVFQANRAGEHGGGIYFSFSSPQIVDNVIENNSARYFGGGLWGSNTVTGAVSRICNNVLLSNQSDKDASNIYVTAKLETVFQENCLFSTVGYDLFVDALESDLDFRGNYFGPLAAGDLEARIKDKYDDPKQKTVICDPVLEFPPAQAPNAPDSISSFEIHGDGEYATDWPFPLCPQAPIYLELKATDRNPYHADWIPVRMRSSESDPVGIVALAWETAPASGIFRLQGVVTDYSLAKEGAIQATIGDVLFFSVEGAADFEISRRVDVPKSYLTAFHLLDEPDSLHVVRHEPKVAWQFRNIFSLPQTGYQLQLSAGRPFTEPAAWQSGQQMVGGLEGTITGAELQDGRTYSLRLSIRCGGQWSDWAETALQMNSLPAAPLLLSPGSDQVVSQLRPTVKLQASSDAEGDPVSYEVQLCQDAAFTQVLANEKKLRAVGQAAQWVAPLDLQDDAEYYWRARACDPFETGPWTTTGHFYVNLVEEPPLPFVLLEPETGLPVYDLQPLFSWDKTVDPDPLSKVHYRLLICPDEKFLPASTVKMETEETSLKMVQSLKNDAAYYWKVEAVDNTGRTTPSQQVGHFSVSTTPSAPQLLEPLADEELLPDGRVAWTKSSDPDPEDSVVYRLQIAAEDFARPVLEEVLTATETTLRSLNSYVLLTDNQEYRLRVRAEDQQGISSNWSKEIGQFFFNQVNTPPGPVSPPIKPDGGVVSVAQPVVAWGAAADADKSDPPATLSYLIQLDQEGTFGPSARQVEVMAGMTQIAVPELADNARWFYRICARDDEGALSTWSPAKSFILNLQNDPPAPFELSGPQDGLTTYKLSGINLTWQAASDFDPQDKLHYLVYLTPAAGGTPILAGKRAESTAFLVNVPLKNETEYLWWVEAEDLAGARTPSAEKYHLTINTTPSAPQVNQVSGGIVTGKETLRWQASADPDPADILTYDLQIVSPDNAQKSLLDLTRIAAAKSASGITSAELRGLKLLKDNQTYAFRMRAVDAHGAASAWSEAASFALDLQNEAPATPAIVEPSAGESRNTRLAVRWSQSSDPDPSDKPEAISYRLQAVPGESFAAAQALERVIPAGQTSLADLELTDNQLWSLRLRAEDGRGGVSAWSAPVKLLVNVANDPPSAPQLSSPQIGAVLTAPKAVQLAWTAARDPDYKSSVTYEVRYWPEGEPEKAISRNNILAVTLLLTRLEAGKTYRWEVMAVDETGLKSTSEIGSFTYRRPEIPPPPSGGLR